MQTNLTGKQVHRAERFWRIPLKFLNPLSFAQIRDSDGRFCSIPVLEDSSDHLRFCQRDSTLTFVHAKVL